MSHSKSSVWNVKLNNGVEIPILGLGTYKALGEEVKKSIKDALEIGYRHFDTADFYKNLTPLGEAIREAISAGKVKREEVFITTKVWPSYYGTGRVEASVRRQIAQSGLDYFDLVLLHWPTVFADYDGESGFPLGENGKVKFGDRSLNDIYAELEGVQHAGLTRAIGVSNFTASQIESLLKSATITPTINQVEAHVYLAQQKLKNFCSERNILLTAFCPLARANEKLNLLEDETLKKIASKYENKTAAHIALRYLIDQGIIVIPKSIRRERLQANFDLFNFELTEEDFKAIQSLDRGARLVWFDNFGTKESPHYPFNDEF